MHIKIDDRLSLDNRIKQILDILRISKGKDKDRMIMVCGEEGSGKSVFAMSGGYYYDRTFDNSRIALTLEKGIEIINNLIKEAKGNIDKIKNKSILLDEIHDVANIRRVLSKKNQTFIDFMRKVRQFNLNIFCCIPSFFITDYYLAHHRLAGLFRTFNYNYNGIEKYGVQFWPKESAMKLWEFRKFKDYTMVRPLLKWADFNKFYPESEQSYKKFKMDDWNNWSESLKQTKTPFQIERDRRWIKQRNILIAKLYSKDMSMEKIGEMIGITHQDINEILNNQKKLNSASS